MVRACTPKLSGNSGCVIAKHKRNRRRDGTNPSLSTVPEEVPEVYSTSTGSIVDRTPKLRLVVMSKDVYGAIQAESPVPRTRYNIRCFGEMNVYSIANVPA